jgi:sigma-B regulation protein RsbU (phosphoserine phosphatase)
VIAVGGHPLPLHISSEGVSRVGEHGPLLGGFSDVTWRDTTVDLEPGSILFAYTDGVTDAIGADGTRYGLQRLCDTLAGFRGRSATEVIQGLTVALSEFQIGAHADDTAALVLRRRRRWSSEHDEHDATAAGDLAIME